MKIIVFMENVNYFIKGLEEKFYVRFYRFEFDLRVRSYHYITYFEYNCQSLNLSNLENIQNIHILFFCQFSAQKALNLNIIPPIILLKK